MSWRLKFLGVSLATAALLAVQSAPVLAQTTQAAKKADKGPTPGCAWIGSRAVHSMVRDDVVAANDYVTLYEKFGCPSKQLRAAFDCTVETALPDQADEIGKRIVGCWSGNVAAQPPKPSSLPPPTANKPTSK